MVEITNGVVKYGRTEKMADYESKRADVELSFNIANGEDADAAIKQVSAMCLAHVYTILKTSEMATAKLDTAVAEAKPAKEKEAAKAPKIPATPKPKATPAADPAAMDEVETAPAETKAAGSVDDGLDDLMGSEPAAREVTDKELTDATQKCQAANKNAPAIRKLLSDLGVKSPPGRIIDLPQEKRQQYLDGLTGVKPLA